MRCDNSVMCDFGAVKSESDGSPERSHVVGSEGADEGASAIGPTPSSSSQQEG